eukprot:Rmarinus@m.18456
MTSAINDADKDKRKQGFHASIREVFYIMPVRRTQEALFCLSDRGPFVWNVGELCPGFPSGPELAKEVRYSNLHQSELVKNWTFDAEANGDIVSQIARLAQ